MSAEWEKKQKKKVGEWPINDCFIHESKALISRFDFQPFGPTARQHCSGTTARQTYTNPTFVGINDKLSLLSGEGQGAQQYLAFGSAPPKI